MIRNYERLLADIEAITAVMGQAEFEGKPLNAFEVKAAHKLLDMYGISLAERMERAETPPMDFDTWGAYATEKNPKTAYLLCKVFGIDMTDERHGELRKFLTLQPWAVGYPSDVIIHKRIGNEDRQYKMGEYADVYRYMTDEWRKDI